MQCWSGAQKRLAGYSNYWTTAGWTESRQEGTGAGNSPAAKYMHLLIYRACKLKFV